MSERIGSLLTAYLDGRNVFAHEILGQATQAPDLFSEKSRLESVIKWCKMEIERTEMAEKTTAQVNSEKSEAEEYRRYRDNFK